MNRMGEGGMSDVTDEMVEVALAAYRKSIVSPDHPTAADIMRSIIHAVAPQIAAQERERCAALVDTFQAEVQANIDDNIARVRVVQSEPGDNRPLIRARDWLAHAAAAIRQESSHE